MTEQELSRRVARAMVDIAKNDLANLKKNKLVEKTVEKGKSVNWQFAVEYNQRSVQRAEERLEHYRKIVRSYQ